ncbi:aldose 1-epimerase [Tundrisphaera sp. TA3]|uniref:aldose 1-epimerase n=1 Tax=Tundrisphaera sp. TA3 TaxID=3435775 RepID=UPI003EBE15B5
MAYRVDTENHGGRTVIILRDETSGASASILPSFGFNMFDLRLPAAGQARRMVVAADDFADTPTRPGRNGTPVLFPYPNRVRDGRFTFRGKEYHLPITNAPNAIHGFAISAAWDVVSQGVDDSGAFAVGRFHLAEHAPEMRPHWPTDAILEIRYSLAGRKLDMTVTVTNPTDAELPYGFGIHPYFRCPFAGAPLSEARVILPASRHWILEKNLPTGEIEPVSSRLDFRRGKSRAGLVLDDVLTGLTYQGDFGVARLIDNSLRSEFRLTFDRGFRELVAFTPPQDQTLLAIEPYTQTTDAINLQARGLDAGLRVLGHGKSDTFRIGMETVDWDAPAKD